MESEYPNSPYGKIQQLLADLGDGRITAEAYLDEVKRLQDKLERAYLRLERMRPADEFPDAQQLVDGAAEALRTVYQGLEMLKGQADAQVAEQPEIDDADEGALEEEGVDDLEEEAVDAEPSETETGLALIREGCDAMAEIVDTTERNERDLEGYSGSLLDGLFG